MQTEPEIENADLNALIVPVTKITRDMLKALRRAADDGGIGGITDNEARYITDIYYDAQKIRIMTNNKVKGLERDAAKMDNEPEPHVALDFLLSQFALIEENVAKILKTYVDRHPMAWFFEQTVGVGPILAACLLANIDIRKAPTAGHIWRFAGYDPSVTWEKKSKRPWNATLKTAVWKIGESFVKASGNERDFYGKLYRERKAREWQFNLSGGRIKTAERCLAGKRLGDNTDAKAWYSGACSPDLARDLLEAGKPPTAVLCKATIGDGVPMLPPAHIHARATRWTRKIFLSHLHQRWHEQEIGPCPAPFSIAHLGHAHRIPPPQISPHTGKMD